MTGNSPNLSELTKDYLGIDFKNKLSSFLGERRDKTESGINAAISGLLSALDNAASTPDGARRLAAAVDDADEGVLSNVDSLFERESVLDMGFGPLQSILGVGTLSELTGKIGRSSGLPGRAISMLIGVVIPVVFGILKKLKSSRELDAAGLSDLLASQRNYIAEAMPDGTRQARRQVYEARRAVPPAREVKANSNVETERDKSSLGWTLPLVLVAFLLALIWYGATHSPVHAGRDDHESSNVEPSPQETMPAGNESPAVRIKPSLPEASTESGSQTYIVKPGDTLSTISKQFYGNTADYLRIFNANSSRVKNPDLIEVGESLEIPMK